MKRKIIIQILKFQKNCIKVHDTSNINNTIFEMFDLENVAYQLNFKQIIMKIIKYIRNDHIYSLFDKVCTSLLLWHWKKPRKKMKTPFLLGMKKDCDSSIYFTMFSTICMFSCYSTKVNNWLWRFQIFVWIFLIYKKA